MTRHQGYRLVFARTTKPDVDPALWAYIIYRDGVEIRQVDGFASLHLAWTEGEKAVKDLKELEKLKEEAACSSPV